MKIDLALSSLIALLVLLLLWLGQGFLGQAGPVSINFSDSMGGTVPEFSIGDSVYATITDNQANISPSSVDSIYSFIFITNLRSHQFIAVTATETGANTGVFVTEQVETSLPATIGAVGQIVVEADDEIRAAYKGRSDTIRIVSNDTLSCFSQDGKHEFVASHLKSITNFNLFNLHRFFQDADGDYFTEYYILNKFNEDSEPFEIPFLSDSEEDVSLSYRVSLDKYNNIAGPVRVNNELQSYFANHTSSSYRGKIIKNNEPIENSLVALQIESSRDRDHDGDNEPGFISGVLLEDVNVQDKEHVWFFIEPVRPLLMPFVGVGALNNCIPADDYTHIVYEARNTDFSLPMDPIPPEKAVVAEFFAPCAVVGERHGTSHAAYNDAFLTIVLTNGTGETQLTKIDVTAYFSSAPTVPVSLYGDEFEFYPSVIPMTITLGRNFTQDDEFVVIEVVVSVLDETSGTFSVTSIIRRRIDIIGSFPDEVSFGPTDDATRAQVIDTNCDLYLSKAELNRAETTNIIDAVTRTRLEDHQTKGTLSWYFGVPFEPMVFVSVADESYFEYYQNKIQEKVWWEGQEEVLNIVDAFYQTKFPGLSFDVISQEAWTPYSEGPDSNIPDYDSEDDPDVLPDVNPFTLMCHFAQNTVPTENGVPFDHAVAHSHDAIIDPSNIAFKPTLVHLYSAYDFVPIVDPNAIRDTGDGYCTASCSGAATKIVGLAEGIGGSEKPQSNSCNLQTSNLFNKPTDFSPASHHSLSLHAPILEELGENPDNSNNNFDVILFQRFLVVAHELGHTLGANHIEAMTDSLEEVQNTIMYTPINSHILFKMHGTNMWSIIQCRMPAFDESC